MNYRYENPKIILKALSDKINDFYLVGGTALSMYYFEHRESYDVDLFSQDLSFHRISDIVQALAKELERPIHLQNEYRGDEFSKYVSYQIQFSNKSICQLDFVADVHSLIGQLQKLDGVCIASKDDIYLRKIYAAGGAVVRKDDVGQTIVIGGRSEAKDFFDLYFLSKTYKPLSEFLKEYGTPVMNEGMIRWFKTFDRLSMKTGLADIITQHSIDFRKMEEHFHKEVNAILSQQIGEVDI